MIYCSHTVKMIPLLLMAWACMAPIRTAGADSKQAALNLKQGNHIIFIGNTFADQLRIHGYVETLLDIRYPELELTIRDLGWSGDTLSLQPRPLNFGSLDDHLTQQRADVVIACFGMNESFAGPDGVEKFRRDWNKMIGHLQKQQYNGKTAPVLVMISPIAHEQIDDRYGDAEAYNKSLAMYTQCMREVAQKNNVLFVDLFSPTLSLSQSNIPTKLTKNGIHLNRYGYWVVSQWIADAIGPPVDPWRVQIDAKKLQITSSGTRATSLGAIKDGLRFSVTDQYLPVPVPPAGLQLHKALAEKQPQLVVKNLRPGIYALQINDRFVIEASDQQWSAGVVPAASPAHQRSEELRSEITDKNAQFFHRWRAPNSEYIFGRRAKPFGVISFPPEMEKLDKIITAKDRTTWSMTKPLVEQRWQLIRLDDSTNQ